MKHDFERADWKRKVLARFKQRKGCIDCGYCDNSNALEFDHIRGQKTRTIASLLYSSWKRIKQELSLCEVVCANCHAIRTAQRKSRVGGMADALVLGTSAFGRGGSSPSPGTIL